MLNTIEEERKEREGGSGRDGELIWSVPGWIGFRLHHGRFQRLSIIKGDSD